MKQAVVKALKRRVLCPICGADLANWREVFGEEHFCIIPRVNALSDTFQAIAFPGGRPDWMSKEQWEELGGKEISTLTTE